MNKDFPQLGLVHVVDDDEAVRRSLDFLLRTAGYRVKRWADGETFLSEVKSAEPACVLLDISMPGLDGCEVQQRMKAYGIDFPTILLTGHGDIELAVQAMKHGAIDFLSKPSDREKILRSLEEGFRILADKSFCASREASARVQLAKLTEREREVLDGLACGYPNKTIAFDLQISARTVEVYRANVMVKLGVSSFADALRIAFAAGLGSEHAWRAEHCRDRRPRISAAASIA
ncbi:MAG: response regulator transcription factor [Chakrabartia sp.]